MIALKILLVEDIKLKEREPHKEATIQIGEPKVALRSFYF